MPISPLREVNAFVYPLLFYFPIKPNPPRVGDGKQWVFLGKVGEFPNDEKSLFLINSVREPCRLRREECVCGKSEVRRIGG